MKQVPNTNRPLAFCSRPPSTPDYRLFDTYSEHDEMLQWFTKDAIVLESESVAKSIIIDFVKKNVTFKDKWTVGLLDGKVYFVFRDPEDATLALMMAL